MDSQDQAKNSLSGHESHGVHVCHKCGWPFPNPHPSARHRRAHKKVCGTIEGYKLIDSEGHTHLNVSDDEEQQQHSDEDRRTPSPKMEKRSISGGTGFSSFKSSEDEVFSDAVQEFSDSGFSSGKEEHLEGFSGSDKNVEKTVEADLDAGQLLKVDGIADIIKPLDSPSKSSQVYYPEVLETASTAPSKETKAEELSIPISSSIDGSPINSEILMDAPKENINSHVGDNGKHHTTFSLGQEKVVKGNEEDDVDKAFTDAAEPPSKTVSKASEAELQLEDTDGKASDVVTADVILSSVQEQSERSGLEMSKPEVESVELSTSVNPVHIKADSAQDIGVGIQGDSVELCNKTGEEKKHFHVLSVANDFPVVDQPEILIEDFKDHKAVKSNLMSLHDLPPEAESVGNSGASVDPVQIKTDTAPLVCTDTEVVKDCDTKGEEKEDLHVLSTADLHVVDQPEILIEDFKDHKAVKSNLMSLHDLPPEAESVGNSEASVDPVQIKSDTAPLVCTDTEVVKDCDTKGEEKEDLHLISTADLHVVDQPEILIEDFKDHKAVKSNLMSLHNPPSEAESVGNSGASVDPVQIKSDTAPLVCTDTEVFKDCEEEKEDLHVLSSADLHVVDEPEIMIEDFKDHKAVKSSHSLTLGSAEAIKAVEEGNEDTVYDENRSSSPSDTNIIEDNLKKEGEKNNLIVEMPVEREADTSGFKATHGEDLRSNGVEAPSDTSRSEKEDHISSCVENESPRDILPENTLVDVSDVVPIVTSVAASMEGDIKPSAKVDSVDSFSVSKVDQTGKLTGGYVGGELENARIGSESTEGAAAEEKCATNTETKLDSASQLSELASLDSVPDSTEVEFDTSDLGSTAQTHSSSQKYPDDDSREVIEETKSSNDSEKIPECVVGSVGTGSESNHTLDADVVEKISNNPVSKEHMTLPIDSGSTNDVADVEVSERNSDKPVEETGPFPIDSGSSTKTSGTVDKDGVGVCSEPKEEDGDDKLLKQRSGASAVDISVDSMSQSDSLEGNWGSVSVLSTQSDAPAYIEAEALVSNDFRARTKSEKDDLQKPKMAPDDKSDVFESPSLTTLVESEGGFEPKATGSEIETLQTNQRPNTEALQSGWFPSLSNVVNESEGRKKNEEIIAKVTNWSAGTGKQHTNLKNLLSEANAELKPNPPSPKQAPPITQKDENGATNNNVSLDTKVASVTGSEASADQVVKKETAKEWSSPARYPMDDNKKEKRKVKGKPTWIPFICCSSVN